MSTLLGTRSNEKEANDVVAALRGDKVVGQAGDYRVEKSSDQRWSILADVRPGVDGVDQRTVGLMRHIADTAGRITPDNGKAPEAVQGTNMATGGEGGGPVERP